MKRLQFEQLESRLLMTAAVTQDGNLLSIIGTNKAEYVNVHQHNVDSFHITGDVTGNGNIYDDISSMQISLGGKSDNLIMISSDPQGYRIFPETLSDGLLIDLGKGHDYTRIWYLGVTGGTGTINASGGRDAIEVAYVFFSELNVSGGGGDDRIRIYQFFAGSIDVNGDFGDNEIYVYDGSASGSLSVTTSDGNDYIEVEYLRVTLDTVITTGAGDDYVYLEYSDFSNTVGVFLGDDWDILEVEECIFDADVIFDGGNSIDELFGHDNVFNENLTIIGFES